jgi:hypothetical protein
MMGKSLSYAYPQRYAEGGDVKMTDLNVGQNEQLGNDMVLLTFADGTKRQTQKALYEAARDLGVLNNMQSGDDFSQWHLNDWASGVVSNPEYVAAHDTFNTRQLNYNNALMEANPEIAKNRLAYVQQYAPNNEAAISAAQQLVTQYYPEMARTFQNTALQNTGMAMGQPTSGGIASLVPETQPPQNNMVVQSLTPLYRPPEQQNVSPTMFGGPVNTQQVMQQATQLNPFRRPT